MDSGRDDDREPHGLTLEYTPAGRNGKATVTARLGNEPLAVETIDLTNPAARTQFAGRLCEGRPGIDQQAVEGELLKAAADLASKPQGNGEAIDFGTLAELDVSRIVRPERFVTREVSGLAVPAMVPIGDKPTGRWFLYLRWADGRRERRGLGSAVGLPDGARLLVYPEPAEPTPTMRPGWSMESRKRWLAGEPAPNPADVFRSTCERLAYYLDLPRDEAPGVTATLALWAMLTYCYQAWDAVPYLYVGGPVGSGKSRVFEVLSRMVFRPVQSSSMTAASMFRTLHTQGGTLLLDEAERLRDTRDPATAELVSNLLAGYKRGGTATRMEPVGDGFRTVQYDVFGPKALACVAGLPPALASRCIMVTMFRAAAGSDKPKRRIDEQPDAWQRLRDELHAVALEHGPTWLDLAQRPGVCPAGIDGRNYELWQPLLALAGWLDAYGPGGLLPLLQEHALASIDMTKDDQVSDADETLLRVLAEARANLAVPSPKEVLEAAQEIEPNTFRQWSPKGVSNTLRRYGIRTVCLHGRKVYSRVTVGDLWQIQKRYGLTLGVADEAEDNRGG